MKTTQDEFFLARVGVDVTHRKNARHRGGKVFGVHHQLLARHLQAPLGHGPELGGQAPAHQQLLRGSRHGFTLVGGHVHRLQVLVGALQGGDLPNLQLQAASGHGFAHGAQRLRFGLKHIAAVDQRDACGGVVGGLAQLQGFVHGLGFTAEHPHVLVSQSGTVAQVVMDVATFQLRSTFQVELARLERAHTSRNEQGFAHKVLLRRSVHVDAVVGPLRHLADFLVQVEVGGKRTNLLLQTLDQFASGAKRQTGNVVDGFVSVQLGALATHMGQGVDEVTANVLQSELKGLEEPDRPGTHDDGVGLDHGCVNQRCNSASLPVRSFQSSASGIGALRLVMLGQPICDNSALSWVMCCWPSGTSSSA